MGQRHQLYVIAKADGRYRTLAALHKQWSYSIGAIARCQLAMQVFRANASLVKQEIQKAERLDWQKEVEAEGVKERQMNLLFPFIATCLIVGAGDKWLLPITIVPTEGDNNDGITVFDITDPDMPRYAFVSLPESEHDGSVQRMIPQDAIKYLEIYRDRQDPFTSEDEDIAKDVAASPLIDAETLQSAWPTLKFYEQLRHRLKNLIKWPRSTEPSSTSSGTPLETGSLRGRTMREVIFKALECNPNELSWIEEAACLPDFDDTLRTTLFEQPKLQEKPSGVALLKRVLKKAPEVHVDLRPFFTLKPAQVLDIIQSLDHSVAVSLPPMPDLTLDNLHELLQTGKLRELHMGDTPNLGLQEALDTISGKPLAAFTHPSLYRLPIELMYVSPERREERLPNYPIGTESGFPVSQLIFLQSMEPHDAVRPCVEGGEGLAWTKISPEAPGRWNGISPLEGPVVIPITLRDSLLSLDRILEQLPEIVADLSSHLIIDLRGFIGIARAGQDAATKHLALRRDKRLLPIPARLYNTYRTSGLSSCERPPVTEAVKRGEWSLLALHEAPHKEGFKISESEIRYAFVTLDDNEQLVSVPVDEFVRTLSSSEIYRSDNSDTRAELVRSFEERMAGTCEGETAHVSHSGLSEVIEAMRLTDVHRAQVEKADEIQGKFRRHKRREFEE